MKWSRKEAEALARELKLRFYRISSKDNVNVEDGIDLTNSLLSSPAVFRYLAESHLKRKKEKQITTVSSPKAGEYPVTKYPLISA